MNFNIYGVEVFFKSPPSNIAQFFFSEWNYFLGAAKKRKIAICVNFSDSINVPSNAVLLQSSYPGEYLAYDNGNVFLFKGYKIHIKLNELTEKSVNINCERDVGEGELFSLLERLLLLKLIELGCSIIHGSCFKLQGKVYAFSSLSGVGKSKLLMHYLRTETNKVGFISDDILIVDKNLSALPYPRGLNIKEFDTIFFRKVLMKSGLKQIFRYFIHILKRKLLGKTSSIFLVRAFLYQFWPSVDVLQAKIDSLIILEKQVASELKEVPVSKEDAKAFLNANIKIELNGFLGSYFRLLDVIADQHTNNLNQHLNLIDKWQIQSCNTFCESVDLRKLVVDNDFQAADIERFVSDLKTT